MARPNILRGTYVTIMVRTAVGPDVYTLLCGITTKSITDQVNTQDSFTRDCDEPEEVATRNIIATSRQWDLRGAGQMNRDQFDLMESLVGQIEAYRFFIGAKDTEDDPELNGYYGGDAMLVTKTITGDDGDMVNIDIAIASDGPWVWTDVPITP